MTHGASPDPVESGRSADKIRRLFGRFIGAGYAFYLASLFSSILDAATFSAGWWTALAATSIFGSGLALGVATFLSSTRWVSSLAAVNAIAFVVAAALWFVAWNGHNADGDYALWFAIIPGMAGLSAAVAWRPVLAYAILVVAVGLATMANHVVRVTPTEYTLVPDLAFAVTFCAVFVAGAVMAMKSGRMLDDSVATTHRAAAAAAAASAKSVERERFDALVHDFVMSTLLGAARHNDDSDHSVTDQARRTITTLDELREGLRSDWDFDANGVVALFRGAASEVDEAIHFRSQISAASDAIRYPAEPARAISGAIAEALRNSVRHAGPNAERVVSVVVDEANLLAIVADNGTGFDRATVSDRRLGIAVSIEGRMRQLDGGAAEVSSTPGAGTTVSLTWKAGT